MTYVVPTSLEVMPIESHRPLAYLPEGCWRKSSSLRDPCARTGCDEVFLLSEEVVQGIRDLPRVLNSESGASKGGAGSFRVA